MIGKEKFNSKSSDSVPLEEHFVVDKYTSSAKADEYVQMAWPHLSEFHSSEPFYEFIGSLVKKYIKSFKDIKPACLEVGFGSGRILYEMYMSGNAGQIVGIEYSPAMLEKSKEILSKIIPASIPDGKQGIQAMGGIELKIGNIQSIVSQDESFNIVVSINILDRVADTAKGISELVRVLKPFGNLVVVTACDYEDNTPLEQRLTPEEFEHKFIILGCNLVEKHVTELLKNVGGMKKRFNEFVYVFNKHSFSD